MEMPGCGERGKPEAGFPRPPRALGNLRRFPHSRSSGGGVSLQSKQNPKRQSNCGPWKSGNPKAGFPLSHCPGKPAAARKKSRPHAGKEIIPGQLKIFRSGSFQHWKMLTRDQSESGGFPKVKECSGVEYRAAARTLLTRNNCNGPRGGFHMRRNRVRATGAMHPCSCG